MFEDGSYQYDDRSMDQATISIAISLKRIADAQERQVAQMDAMANPTYTLEMGDKVATLSSETSHVPV